MSKIPSDQLAASLQTLIVFLQGMRVFREKFNKLRSRPFAIVGIDSGSIRFSRERETSLRRTGSAKVSPIARRKMCTNPRGRIFVCIIWSEG